AASMTSVPLSTAAPRGTTDHPPVGFEPARRKTTDSVAKSTAGGSPPPMVAGQRRRYAASSDAATACGASGDAAAYAPRLMVRNSTGPPDVDEGTAVQVRNSRANAALMTGGNSASIGTLPGEWRHTLYHETLAGRPRPPGLRCSDVRLRHRHRHVVRRPRDFGRARVAVRDRDLRSAASAPALRQPGGGAAGVDTNRLEGSVHARVAEGADRRAPSQLARLRAVAGHHRA